MHQTEAVEGAREHTKPSARNAPSAELQSADRVQVQTEVQTRAPSMLCKRQGGFRAPR